MGEYQRVYVQPSQVLAYWGLRHANEKIDAAYGRDWRYSRDVELIDVEIKGDRDGGAAYVEALVAGQGDPPGDVADGEDGRRAGHWDEGSAVFGEGDLNDPRRRKSFLPDFVLEFGRETGEVRE